MTTDLQGDPDRAAPLAVTSHLTPVPDEIDACDLPVTGALPPELTGRYLRNGPNPPANRPGWPPSDGGHWFLGAGMLHGIRIAGGRAEWYRNRWVRTRALAGDPPQRPDGRRNLAVNAANTHIIEHGGRLLALDATDLAAGPVASVRLPRAVPAGFHGSWITDGGRA